MKFKDLRIGDKFRFVPKGNEYEKTSSGTYTAENGELFVGAPTESLLTETEIPILITRLEFDREFVPLAVRAFRWGLVDGYKNNPERNFHVDILKDSYKYGWGYGRSLRYRTGKR